MPATPSIPRSAVYAYRQPAPFAFIAVLLALVFASACGTPAPTREWTPEDHGQPAGEPSGRSAPSEAQAADEDPEATRQRAARALWNMQCAKCHGRQGRGDGAERPPGSQIPDFTDVAWQSARTDEALGKVIHDGRGLMPEFGKSIPREAIDALIQHIRGLAPRQP